MSDYVADNYDRYDAELSGTYTTDEVNKVITFGTGGEGDTGYTLPSDSEWLLIEVYEVEDEQCDDGYTVWHENTTRLSDYMVRARAVALAEYTTFKITATHYNGDNTADVYTGDESNALSIFNSGVSFTPSALTWKLECTLTSPTNKLLVCTDSYFCSDTWLC